MWKLLSSEQELKEALEATKTLPSFLFVHNSIQNKLLNRFPEAIYTIYLHENNSGYKLWLVYQEDPWTTPWIIFGNHLNAKFDKKLLFEAFDELSKRYPKIYHCRTMYLGQKSICDLYKEWLNEALPQFYNEIVYYPTHLYYMTNEQKQKILDLKINLPEGYKFAEVDFDKDPEIITSAWLHNKKGDLDLTKAKLRNLPCSVIKDVNDSPISFEMTFPFSLFNHLYTLPEHRGKGLGNATERDLSKKCIRLGITPSKTIETFNTEVLESSNRSPYWTRWDDEGKPIEYIFMAQECEKRIEMEKNKIENGH